MNATPASSPSARFRRRHVIVVTTLLTSALLAWLWLRAEPNAELGYVTEAADRGPIEMIVTATGTVNPVTTVQVGTYVSGPIRELFADFNSPVRKGQRVAKIDPRMFQVKVQQAEANVATASARVEKSRSDLALKKLGFERNGALYARELVAQNDLDTARSQYQQAQAQLALDQAAVQQAEAQLEEARIHLGYTDITSPVDGVVVSRSVNVGQTVAASFQTPTLFEIAQDLTKMQVNTSVSESDIGGVADAQPAWFTVDAHPGRRFEGRVAQVRNAPVTLQNVVTYDVVVAVENADLALKPGMTATVSIMTARRDDALRASLRALRFRPDAAATDTREAGVWREQANGELERITIQTGIRGDKWVEVTGGAVAPGDLLIVARRRAADDDTPPAQSPFSPQRRR